MSDSVIPSMTAEDVAPASPEVIAQRKRVELAHAAFTSIGAMPIKCIEAQKGAELLAYLDAEHAAECKILDNIIATEALGKPVEVNGSTIRLAQATH